MIIPTDRLSTRLKIFQSVIEERNRQDEKFGPQTHSRSKWLAILVEEVGEVAKAGLDIDRADDLASNLSSYCNYIDELHQVAAVVFAILENEYEAHTN